MKLAYDVAAYLGFEVELVLKLAKHAPRSYRRYEILKASGGTRVIYHPASQTKSLQYALSHLVFGDMEIHSISRAYKRGFKSPLKSMASEHVGYPYSVRCDFSDFFYSIKPDDLIPRVSDVFPGFDAEDVDFITNVSFIMRHEKMQLAIGAVTSPIISNIVMKDLDGYIFEASKYIDADSCVTRYADDIIFSSHNKGSCAKFVKSLRELLDSSDMDLVINESKTQFMSRGTRRRIGGLSLTNDGRVVVPRSVKRKIRSLLKRLKDNVISDDDRKSLRGYMSYVVDSEPGFINSLSIKYGATLVNSASTWRPLGAEPESGTASAEA